MNVEANQNVSNITTTFSSVSDGLEIEWYTAEYSLVNSKFACNSILFLFFDASLFFFSYVTSNCRPSTVNETWTIFEAETRFIFHTHTMCPEPWANEPTIRPLDWIELMWQFLSFHLQSNIQNINFQFSECHYRWVTVVYNIKVFGIWYT